MPTFKSKITISSVQRMMPGDVLFDTQVQGFGARRQHDAISYFVKTRVLGRQKWITIGKHGSPWTPETARREANDVLAEAGKGHDRVSQKRRLNGSPTVSELADSFLTGHGAKLKARTLEEYTGLTTRYIKPQLGSYRVDALTRSDIIKAHTAWQAHPRTANHAMAVLSKMLSWAMEHGLRPLNSNPCFGIKKYKETKRQRYLTMAELARLGAALDQAETERLASHHAVAALRLLVLTGARLSEILTLRWSYVDSDRRLLILPDSKTGEKTIQLSDAAMAVLASISRVEGNPFVIVGHRTGQCMVELFKPWSIIRTLANLEDVRIHDLRHTFASVAVASGGSLPIIGKMLGHHEPRTTARYAHLADDPVRVLTQTTGQAIAAAMLPKVKAAE